MGAREEMTEVRPEPDGVAEVRADWDAATRDAMTACGLPDLAAIYTAMQRAWYRELGELGD